MEAMGNINKRVAKLITYDFISNFCCFVLLGKIESSQIAESSGSMYIYICNHHRNLLEKVGH